MIEVTPQITLHEKEIKMEFIYASGPGGQNVNKVNSAVQLRFDTNSLPNDVRNRLSILAGSRMAEDCVLIIKASRFRSQFQNRRDAVERLVKLIQKAAQEPKLRKPTIKPAALNRIRIENKRRRSKVKQLRQNVSADYG